MVIFTQSTVINAEKYDFTTLASKKIANDRRKLVFFFFLFYGPPQVPRNGWAFKIGP
jgi:hypothetical protein